MELPEDSFIEWKILIPKIEGTKISSLSSWQDEIFIGTIDGQLICYTVEEDQASGKFTFGHKATQFLKRGKKPVEKLLVIPDLLKILTLCDGHIDMLNLADISQEVSSPFASLKNISYICSAKNSALYRLCVQIKKKLSFYEYEGSFKHLKDVSLPDPALTMEWFRDTVFIGTKKGYLMFNLEAEQHVEIKELFPLEKSSSPFILSLSSEILLVKDEIGVFVSEEGIPTRGNILWKNPPNCVAFSGPYIIALNLKLNLIEVHNYLNQNSVETLPFPKQKNFRFISSYEGSKYILVASSTVIYTLKIFSLERQIKWYLDKHRVQELIAVVEYLVSYEPTNIAKKKLSYTHTQTCLYLFKQGKFSEAFEHMKESDLDPRVLIHLFPTIKSPFSKFVSSEKIDKYPILNTNSKQNEAKGALLKYLETLLNPKKSDDLQKEINTCVLKLYLEVDEKNLSKSRKELVELLIKSTHHIFIEEVEPKLNEHKMFNSLALLAKNIGDYKKALTIWFKLGSGELKEDRRDGIDETIDLLSTLDISSSYQNSQLIWDYAKWVIERDEKKGIKIFVPNKRPNPLIPQQILEYFNNFKSSSYLSIQFLDYIIFAQSTQEEELHTKLGILYIEDLLTEISPNQRNVKETWDQPALAEKRKRLKNFLQISKHFNETMLLARIISFPLYEESIILYKRLKQHHKALEIIVEMLGDYNRAEEYCSQHKHESEDLTLSLFKVYLSQEKGPQDFIPPAALKLLNGHASELNPAHILPMLPSNMPLQLVSNYLTIALRTNIHEQKQNKIVKNLSKANYTNVSYELSRLTTLGALITKETICKVCMKYIGEKVFVRYPNGSIIHFRCAKDLSVCPLTGIDFSKF